MSTTIELVYTEDCVSEGGHYDSGSDVDSRHGLYIVLDTRRRRARAPSLQSFRHGTFRSYISQRVQSPRSSRTYYIGD